MMRKKYILLLAILPLSPLMIARAEPELKGSPEQLRQFLHPHARTTSLYAEAERKAYSDRAIVSLEIKTEADELALALERNTHLRRDIQTRLQNAGVKSENIKGAKFASSPQYGWFGRKLDSYKVSTRLVITTSDEKHLRLLAAIADDSKDIQLVATEFEHSEKERFEAEVKSEALKKVLAQKALYEQQLNVTLKPVNFHEGRIILEPTHVARQRRQEKLILTQTKQTSSLYDSDSAPSVPEGFDEVRYHTTMTVEFEIINTK